MEHFIYYYYYISTGGIYICRGLDKFSLYILFDKAYSEFQSHHNMRRITPSPSQHEGYLPALSRDPYREVLPRRVSSQKAQDSIVWHRYVHSRRWPHKGIILSLDDRLSRQIRVQLILSQ